VTGAELRALEDAGVLTAREAEAIFLHDVKGLSYRQIALGSGVAMQTVFAQAKRGHEKIRARKEAA
jgi:DNA-directed RNA polymerase specialized sigma24 family protein